MTCILEMIHEALSPELLAVIQLLFRAMYWN